MKRIGNAISCVFIIISIFVFVISCTFPAGSNGALGPGFFPKVLSIIVMILSSIELITSGKSDKDESEKEEQFFFKESLRVWVALVIIIIYLISLKYIGFLIMTPLYLIIMFLYFKTKNIITLIGIPIGITCILYFIFMILLKVQLPHGIFF